jgi:hypothetical protein
MKVIYVAALTIALLMGCSKQTPQEFNLNIPDHLSQEAKDLLTETWPKVRKAAPGLDKYASVLKIININESLTLSDEERQHVTVEFLCPDDRSIIPGAYRSWGQHCFLEITRDGTVLSISKKACQSVCLDQEITTSHSPLRLSLLNPGEIVEETEEQYKRSSQRIVFSESESGVYHKDFLKSPNKYKGLKLSFNAKIMFIEEENGQTIIQAYINRNYDTVLIFYPRSAPVYEGDIVQVLGVGAGTFEGTNRMGVPMSWPLINAKFVKKVRSGEQ